MRRDNGFGGRNTQSPNGNRRVENDGHTQNTPSGSDNGSRSSNAAETASVRRSGGKLNPGKCNLPAILISVVMLLYLGADRMLAGNYINSTNPYATVVIAQLCVFLVPCAFFFAIGGINGNVKPSHYGLSAFSVKHTGFIFSCLPTLVVGGMLIKYLSYLYIGSVSPSALSISGNNDFLYVLLSSVIVPAIAEEILLRGVIYTEYEKKLGAFGAILASSVLFAFIHFDAANFPAYLYAGIILGAAMHMTGSVLAPMLLHLLNNFICIYSDAFLRRISKESISTFFVVFILGVLLLLSLFVFFEALEWLLLQKADTAAKDDGKAKRLFVPGMKKRSVISGIFLAPAFWVAFVIFFIKAFLL